MIELFVITEQSYNALGCMVIASGIGVRQQITCIHECNDRTYCLLISVYLKSNFFQ